MSLVEQWKIYIFGSASDHRKNASDQAHLASIGYPIIGDYKYGSKKVNDRLKEQYGLKSQLLHAYRLEMPACTGELSNLSERKFVAPLPKLFQNILKAEKYSEE